MVRANSGRIGTFDNKWRQSGGLNVVRMGCERGVSCERRLQR